MKGIIIYKGKYGATRQYADWLSEELKLPAIPAGNRGDKDTRDYGYVILGSSVYIGKLQLKQWLKKHAGELVNKKIFLFVVCGTPAKETEKLNSYTRSSVPPEIVEKCSVYYLPGRLIYNGLSLTDKFMLRMGAMIASQAETKKAMLTDYDQVRRENLNGLIKDVRVFREGNKAIRQ
jgi:menaquinone-dependent protoporphyrinogen IX oxidase